MVQKAGSLYGRKNKEQWAKKKKKKIADWVGPPSQPWQGWEGPELACVWGCTDRMHCISSQGEHLLKHEHYLTFGLLMWHHGQTWLPLGLRKLVQHQHSLFSKLALKGNFYHWDAQVLEAYFRFTKREAILLSRLSTDGIIFKKILLNLQNVFVFLEQLLGTWIEILIVST